jgi:CRISPR-associated protein Cas5h
MFAFEIWGKFASFRDPFTISQNISLPIPPKSTVAGMLASILGVEEYLGKSEFSDFEYSVVAINPIRKKSFSQNYINDYTKFTSTHIDFLRKGEYEKIARYGLRRKFTGKNWTPQTQINRELILNPHFLIIVKNYAHKDKLVEYLQKRISKFPFYLGNSEFAGNFRHIKIYDAQEMLNMPLAKVDSFILESDIKNIEFQEGVRYSNISFAAKLTKQRTPINMANIILGSSAISVKNMTLYKIKCRDRDYYCRFL